MVILLILMLCFAGCSVDHMDKICAPIPHYGETCEYGEDLTIAPAEIADLMDCLFEQYALIGYDIEPIFQETRVIWMDEIHLGHCQSPACRGYCVGPHIVWCGTEWGLPVLEHELTHLIWWNLTGDPYANHDWPVQVGRCS